MLMGHSPSEAAQGGHFLLFFSFWRPQDSLDTSASLRILPLSSHGHLTCASVSSPSVSPPLVCVPRFPHFYTMETAVILYEGPIKWPHPNLMTSVKSLFPNKVPFLDSRARTSTYHFKAHRLLVSHIVIAEWNILDIQQFCQQCFKYMHRGLSG